MEILKNKIQLYEASYQCDACKEGEMGYTGSHFLTYPSKYEHSCDNCGHKINLLKRYPRTVQRVEEEVNADPPTEKK